LSYTSYAQTSAPPATPGSLVSLLAPHPATAPGQAATQLADGTWLLTGGQNNNGAASATAWLVNPATGQTTALATPLLQPRTGHSATLLPSGKVLLLGGTDANGNVIATAEQYDPATAQFTAAATSA
jgi:hypothetical protein